jgi:hypothetical protein
VAGADYANSNKGAAYVFSRSGTIWTQEQKLIASDGAASNQFGWSVSISSDSSHLVIGANQINNSQGATYVFSRSNTTWTQKQELTASDGDELAWFGSSVSITLDGTRLVVGANGAEIESNTYQGAAYVFSLAPTLTTISPTLTTYGGGDFTLTANGADFFSNSTIDWNGVALVTTYVSPTQLTATVPAANIVSLGTASITVVTPNLGTSSPQTFTIGNPVPTSTSISPTSATVGDPTFTITANGTNFVSTSTINWNGTPLTTTYISASQLTATIPGADLTSVGTASVTVFSPSPGGGTSNSQPFTIYNPVPITSFISPTSTTAGGGNFTLTVNDTNFVSSSVVQWNGTSLATTYISPTELTATVPSTDIVNAGTASVTVFNGTPGGGTTSPQTFTINNPIPTTSSISPTSATLGDSTFILTANGTNFVSSSTINWNGTPLTTTYVSATELTAIVPEADLTSAGTVPVTVYNGTPGGGTSSSQTFTINNPIPTTSSISPTSASVGDSTFTLTANGTNFLPTSTINWSGAALVTTYLSATQLTAIVPETNLTSAGTAPVTVFNETPGGGASNSQTFTIIAVPHSGGGGGGGGGGSSSYIPPTILPPTTCQPGVLFNSTTGQPCASTTLTPPTIPPTCSITTTLRLGSKGSEVQCLQTILKISADGSFGLKTKVAVMAFQKLHNLTPDGVVGKKTRGALGE